MRSRSGHNALDPSVDDILTAEQSELVAFVAREQKHEQQLCVATPTEDFVAFIVMPDPLPRFQR
jgi:hypothetical protein